MAARQAVMYCVPLVLNEPSFLQKWDEWVRERRKLKRPVTGTCLQRQLAMLATWGLQDALESIEQSLTYGWQGLFPPRRGKTANTMFSGLREFASRGVGQEES